MGVLPELLAHKAANGEGGGEGGGASKSGGLVKPTNEQEKKEGGDGSKGWACVRTEKRTGRKKN